MTGRAPNRRRGTCSVRALDDGDQRWRGEQLRSVWGATEVARLGERVDASRLDGFVALLDGRRAGLLTYLHRGGALEVVTIQAEPTGVGLGRALMDAAAGLAEALGARRLWLITTDSNTSALAFYRRWGMTVAAVHREGVARSRAVKPSIPHTDEHGVALRDEIELELPLPRPRPRAPTRP